MFQQSPGGRVGSAGSTALPAAEATRYYTRPVLQGPVFTEDLISIKGDVT
jgi:hypothetical protein